MNLPMFDDTTRSIDDIEGEICSILADVTERPLGTIGANSPLDEGLGVDSLALIETQVAIEERFGIAMPDIDDDSFADLRTVKDLARSVEQRVLHGGADG